MGHRTWTSAREPGRGAWALFVVSALLATGCTEEAGHPPAAPNPDGATVLPPPSGGPRDGGGGTDGAAPDGAPTGDGGPVAGCVSVAEGPFEPNRVAVFVDGSPQPFPVAAAFATWDVEACERPTLILGLSDGWCVPGFGQQLLVLLARDDIGTGVFPGENLLEAEPFDDAMAVRYLVPGAAAEPDVWGSCTGAAGSITFSDLGETAGAAVRGTFSMTLTDCTDPRDSPPATTTGAFDLTVPEAFETACP